MVGGATDVIAGMGFPAVPSKGILMERVTPVSVITRVAVTFSIAEGVKVMYIWQV
jgi:hypothetical protein